MTPISETDAGCACARILLLVVTHREGSGYNVTWSLPKQVEVAFPVNHAKNENVIPIRRNRSSSEERLSHSIPI